MSHRERRITVHSRVGQEWFERTAIAGGRVRVSSLDIDLVVDEVYRFSAIGRR